jgi:hypothetical protein
MTVNALIDAVDRLTETLRRENEALTAMDLPAAAALLPLKMAAVEALATALAAARGASGPEISAGATVLRDRARENRDLLRRATEAQQRVIGIVARAAAASAPGLAYGTEGRLVRLQSPVVLLTRA